MLLSQIDEIWCNWFGHFRQRHFTLSNSIVLLKKQTTIYTKRQNNIMSIKLSFFHNLSNFSLKTNKSLIYLWDYWFTIIWLLNETTVSLCNFTLMCVWQRQMMQYNDSILYCIVKKQLFFLNFMMNPVIVESQKLKRELQYKRHSVVIYFLFF